MFHPQTNPEPDTVFVMPAVLLESEDLEVPEVPRVSVSEEIRRFYRQGEWFSDPWAMDHFDCSLGLVGLARKTLEGEGYVFESRRNAAGVMERHATRSSAPPAPSKPVPHLGAAARIRERLETGEWLSGRQVAADYGCAGTALQQVVKSLRSHGRVVRQRTQGRRVLFKLLPEDSAVPARSATQPAYTIVSSETPRAGSQRRRVYDMLLSGRRITALEVAAEVGCSTSILPTVVRAYFENDPRLKIEREGLQVFYSLDTSAAGAEVEHVPTLRRPTKRGEPPVVPTFGSDVRVIGMMLGDDDLVTLVLRDETNTAWQCEVVGFTKQP
jgi:biotin operon repressor